MLHIWRYNVQSKATFLWEPEQNRSKELILLQWLYLLRKPITAKNQSSGGTLWVQKTKKKRKTRKMANTNTKDLCWKSFSEERLISTSLSLWYHKWLVNYNKMKFASASCSHMNWFCKFYFIIFSMHVLYITCKTNTKSLICINCKSGKVLFVFKYGNERH